MAVRLPARFPRTILLSLGGSQRLRYDYSRGKSLDQACIGIIGDYDPAYTGHRDTGQALEDAGRRLGTDLTYEWVATDQLEAEGTSALEEFDGLWASPGSPYRSMEGALTGIRYARESNKPFMGT